MPFRDDLSALETRRETLQTELAQVQEQKRELAGLEAREKQLAESLEATNAVLAGMRRGAAGKRSLLDNVSIASPCSASWDTMQGNGRVRFCLECEKNVYNLSAMPREEAEELLQSRGDLCVRLYQRADGTMITADCPVGLRIRRAKQRKFALLGIGAAVFSSGLASALAARIACPSESTSNFQEAAEPGYVTMGMARPLRVPPQPPTVAAPGSPQQFLLIPDSDPSSADPQPDIAPDGRSHTAPRHVMGETGPAKRDPLAH